MDRFGINATRAILKLRKEIKDKGEYRGIALKKNHQFKRLWFKLTLLDKQKLFLSLLLHTAMRTTEALALIREAKNR